MLIPDRDQVGNIMRHYLSPVEVAAWLSVSVGMVYWYEKKGLLKPVVQTWGRRLFDPVDVRTLAQERRILGRRRKKSKPDDPAADKEPRRDE
jgi:hypothetical protein